MNRVLAVLFLISALSGCISNGLLGRPASVARSDEATTSLSTDGTGLAVYLQVMEDLLEGDTVRQAETFQRISRDASAAPNTTNRLKLAIALAIPGHSGSNAEHAQAELREVLAASEVLLPEERILATLQLAQIEQRLLLDLEAQQTQSAAAQSIEQQTSNAERRVQQLQEENQALRAELEEAQNILNEITNIERSIRERESAD